MGDKESISPGGIYYSAIGSLSCCDSEDAIYLVTAIDNENEKIFSDIYQLLNRRFITKTEKIPIVHLKVFENAERCEFYENITQKLTINFENLNEYNGILINMITGFDISIEDLMKIRSDYKGLIYLDIHTLSRGMEENNQRIFRIIPNAQKWISSVDFLQVNEHELYTISSKEDELEIVKDALLSGLKYLLLTKGERGCRMYWLSEGELNSFYLPAIKIQSKNKIGCGDIFGSVFFFTYIKTLDIKHSLMKANTAAGCAAGYSDIYEFQKLKNDTLSRFN